MARRSFHQQLVRLQNEILDLGDTVQQSLMQSVKALLDRNHPVSRELIAADRAINERCLAIESDALTLIATQQPLAGDLRTIFTAVEIANELERIADYAKGIAKVNLMMGEEPLLEPCLHLPVMASEVRDMLQASLQAFVDQDAAEARAIPQRDHLVDELHNRVYRELLALITSDPSTTNRATFLLWVVHNLERAGDRVINICERVVYNVTGEIVELDVQEGEYLGLESLS
ncbi:MAG TPA: phosphate signaling complex protein PhoU [Anaerolineae bacterium]|nr:phosphate signaling complex protein PhoU [Anaerolineae bacterium]